MDKRRWAVLLDSEYDNDEDCKRELEKLRSRLFAARRRGESLSDSSDNFLCDPATREPLRDLSGHAVWTVSTAKPGNGVEQLLDHSTDTYWQSDGPQPHSISAQFSSKFKLSEIQLYLSFEQDESYTPAIISIRVGSSFHDLRHVRKNKELIKPQGWIRIPLGDVHEDEDPSDMESLDSDEDDLERMTTGELAERDHRRRVRAERRRIRKKSNTTLSKISQSYGRASDGTVSPSVDVRRNDMSLQVGPKCSVPNDLVMSSFENASNGDRDVAQSDLPNANESAEYIRVANEREQRRNKSIVLAHMLQIVIHCNHQNGRDSHIRQVKVLGPSEQISGKTSRFTSVAFQAYESIR